MEGREVLLASLSLTVAEDPFASLRQAHADLSSRSTRFAVAALIVFAAGSLTFARALRSMNGGDVQNRVGIIRGYAEVAGEDENLPAITRGFLRHEAIKPPPGITPAEALTKKRELEAGLQRDIEASFTIEQTAVGSTFHFNILYWSPLLPFVLLIAYLYLGINDAKMQAIRHVIRTRMRLAENVLPIDALEVGQSSDTTFGTYPRRLATLAYCGTFAALVGLVVYALGIWITLDVWLPVAEVLFALTVYTILLMRWLRLRISREAAAVAGEPFEQKTTWLRRVLERGRAMVRQRPRSFVWSGAGATLCTLFLATASKSCGNSAKGTDLFLGRNEAVWPVSVAEQDPSLGRWMYIVSIVFASIAIVFTLLTLSSRIARWIDRPWVRDAMRCLSVAIFFRSLCEFGFIDIVNNMPVIWELMYWLYWLIPSLLYIWMTAIRKRRYGNAWRMHVRPFLIGLYAPAIVLVPASLVLLVVLCVVGLSCVIPGIAAYVIGVTLLAAGAVVAFESVAVPAQDALPEVFRGSRA